MITKISNDDFSAVKASKLAIVDFNATWCGPCKMLAPVIDDLAGEYAGKIDFYSLDIDENPGLTAEFGIQGVPTLIMFKSGVKADMIVGFNPKPILKQRFDAFLG